MITTNPQEMLYAELECLIRQRPVVWIVAYTPTKFCRAYESDVIAHILVQAHMAIISNV